MAADQGLAQAQYFLGLGYNNGEGVPKDLVRAYMWFNLSAAQGEELAQIRRDLRATLMTPQQIAQAQAMATRCFESNYSDCD